MMYYSENSFFKLFASCILVKGYINHVICDVDRKAIQLIPDWLYEVLIKETTIELNEILAEFENEASIANEYFKFLIEKEYGFITNTPELFPNIKFDFIEPEVINNAIIEVGHETSDFLIKDIIDQLSSLGCKYLEFRITGRVEVLFLKESFIDYSNTPIQQIIVHIESNDENLISYLFEISNPRISDVFIYGSNKTNIQGVQDYIHFIERPLLNNSCGHISKSGFTCNLKTFSEAQNFNTCLNKKISFGTKGEIKNCPSFPNSFGNVQFKKIEEVVFDETFNKLWNINKDNISICKDCEFRYVCTDCRAFTTNPMDLYSKPLKCGYDPYSGSWSNWQALPDNLQAMEHYGLDPKVNSSNSF